MEKLLGHRKARRGNGNEFLVRWAGKDAATDPPTPWSDSYEPESGVADDLIEGYLYFARVDAVESKWVSADVKPLFHLARRALANAVCLDRSATSRRCRHAANPPRAPPRSVLSAGVRPCGRCRKPGGAAIGVSRSTRTGSLSAAAAMVGAEPSSSAAAAAAAAAIGPLAADRAAWRRRRAVGASVGARRPSSGPQLDVRRPEPLQQEPAHVRRP